MRVSHECKRSVECRRLREGTAERRQGSCKGQRRTTHWASKAGNLHVYNALQLTLFDRNVGSSCLHR